LVIINLNLKMDNCEIMSGACFTLAVGSALYGCKVLTDLSGSGEILVGTLLSFIVFNSFAMLWHGIGNR
jgi:hypothetical protein